MNQPHEDHEGLGKGRIETFSEGVFGIAITLLVLETHVLPVKDTRCGVRTRRCHG